MMPAPHQADPVADRVRDDTAVSPPYAATTARARSRSARWSAGLRGAGNRGRTRASQRWSEARAPRRLRRRRSGRL